MTVDNYIYSNKTSRPTLRAAWRAVKREVTLCTITAVTTVLGVVASVKHAAMGDTSLAIIWGTAATLSAIGSLSRAVRAVDIWKNMRTPKF